MSAHEDEKLILLRELRAGQIEALRIQREQFELYKAQWERAERINTRAEALQERSAATVALARRIVVAICVLGAGLIGLMIWRQL